jgi:hypothetical protein
MATKENIEVVEDNQIDDANTDDNISEANAADTLTAGGGINGGDVSKSEVLSQLMNMFAGMGKEDLSHFLDDALAQIGQEADNIPNDAAAKNAASITAKTVKEDIEDMFGGDDLTEDFKEKASTIFEAAVNTRLTVEVARLEEDFEAVLNEEIENIREELSTKMDEYLDYVVSNWVQENKIAIDTSLRSEILENFVSGLHNLFVESNINVPDEQIDVIEGLTQRIEELENHLNEAIDVNLELQNVVIEAEKSAAFEEVSESLTATQIEKLRVLSEGIESSDVETYRKKVNILKENYFGDKKETKTNLITEEADEGLEEEIRVPAHMAKYVNAISRNKSVK